MIFLGALQSTHASYFIVHVADCLHCCLDNGICSLHVSHNLWVSFADCVSDVIAYGGCHVKSGYQPHADPAIMPYMEVLDTSFTLQHIIHAGTALLAQFWR